MCGGVWQRQHGEGEAVRGRVSLAKTAKEQAGGGGGMADPGMECVCGGEERCVCEPGSKTRALL